MRAPCIRAECSKDRGHPDECSDGHVSAPVVVNSFLLYWRCTECRRRWTTEIAANVRTRVWRRCIFPKSPIATGAIGNKSPDACNGTSLVDHVECVT